MILIQILINYYNNDNIASTLSRVINPAHYFSPYIFKLIFNNNS